MIQKDVNTDVDKIESTSNRILVRVLMVAIAFLVGSFVLLLKDVKSVYERRLEQCDIKFQRLDAKYDLLVNKTMVVNDLDRENSKIRNELREKDSVRTDLQKEIIELKKLKR